MNEPFATDESQREELTRLQTKFWKVAQARYANGEGAYHPHLGTALKELAEVEYRINDPGYSRSIGAIQSLFASIDSHLYDAIPRIKIEIA